jgi:SPX domain protein involved in polyphosphate accumulation
VTIPDDVARYYLEQNDKVKVLEAQNRIKDNIISNCEKRVTLQTQIITTYVSDSAIYKQIVATKDKEISLNKKEIRRQKFQKITSWIVGGVVIVLIVI